MKNNKILICAYCLIFFLLSCSEDKVSKKYYSNGQLHIEQHSRKGKKEGMRKVYYENGQLNWEVAFVNDKENGIYKEYYPSSAIKKSIVYKDGKQHGVTIEYFENGNKRSIQTYKNGISEGMTIFYFPNGKLQQYALRENDSTIFYHDYNEQGELTGDYHYLDIEPKQGDTIHEGDNYKAKIKLYAPLEYQEVYISIFITKGDEEHEEKFWKGKVVNGELLYEKDNLHVGTYTIGAKAYGFNYNNAKIPALVQPKEFYNARTIVVLQK